MKPTFRLHKLPQGYVLTSDEKGEGKGINVPVIAQDFDFSSLSPEDQKEIGWFDVEKLAIEYEKNHYDGDLGRGPIKIYCDAFQKAQELLGGFTLEDMENAFYNGWIYRGEGHDFPRAKKEYLQQLSQPKSWEVEAEVTNGKAKIIRIS